MLIHQSFIGYAAPVPMPTLRVAVTVFAERAVNIPVVEPDRHLFGRKAANEFVAPPFKNVDLVIRQSFIAQNSGKRRRQRLIIWNVHIRLPVSCSSYFHANPYPSARTS